MPDMKHENFRGLPLETDTKTPNALGAVIQQKHKRHKTSENSK